MRELSRVIVAVLAVVLLLAPTIWLNAVENTVPKFAIIFGSTSLFVTAVSVISKARMAEVFGAGAAYAAVMVVFVSGDGVQGSGSSGALSVNGTGI